MKLTNSMRDAFVRSAMDDVPSIDYAEKIRSEAQKLAVAGLPPKVRAIYADAALRPYVGTYWRNVANVHMNLPGKDREEADTFAEKLKHLKAASEEQSASHTSLRAKLKAVAYGVTTRKALAESLPEFVKYLPADEQAALRTVPVLANVVTDFVKAGWPKGGKKNKVAA